MEVVGEEAKQEVCLTITPNIICGEPIYGCTDPKALNYDATATVDDGSCTYLEPLEGCTDPASIFYNPLATIDDGSCCDTSGCWDGYDVFGPTVITGTQIDLDLWSGSGAPITPNYNVANNPGNYYNHYPQAYRPCNLGGVRTWSLQILHNYESSYPADQLEALYNYMQVNGVAVNIGGQNARTIGPMLHSWDEAIAAVNSLGIYTAPMLATDVFSVVNQQHHAQGYFQQVCFYSGYPNFLIC